MDLKTKSELWCAMIQVQINHPQLLDRQFDYPWHLQTMKHDPKLHQAFSSKRVTRETGIHTELLSDHLTLKTCPASSLISLPSPRVGSTGILLQTRELSKERAMRMQPTNTIPALPQVEAAGGSNDNLCRSTQMHTREGVSIRKVRTWQPPATSTTPTRYISTRAMSP